MNLSKAQKSGNLMTISLASSIGSDVTDSLRHELVGRAQAGHLGLQNPLFI
jgi:hypothetical protein